MGIKGGKREGAGRKPGSKGAVTQKRAEIAKAALDSGLTPLEYMLSLVRDVSLEGAVRLDAAKSAAPYVHPKLASIEHKGEGGGPIQTSLEVRFV